MIKLTLGLRESVTQLVGDDGELVTSYQTDGAHDDVGTTR